MLAEFAPPSVSGNFQTVTRKILEKVPPQNGRMSYTYDRYAAKVNSSSSSNIECRLADISFIILLTMASHILRWLMRHLDDEFPSHFLKTSKIDLKPRISADPFIYAEIFFF